jgi:DNA-binding NtrC family response regulator
MRSASSGKPAPTARSLARAFDSCGEAVWIVGADQRILWLNEACAAWLQVAPAQLVGRIASASNASDDPLDKLAAALAKPPGMDRTPLQTSLCQPQNVAPKLARYLLLGEGESSLVLVSTGREIASISDDEHDQQTRIRAKMNQWRKRDAAWGGIVAAGSSRAAKRVRGQIQLAVTSRENVSLIGPSGCGAEAIARRIHALRSSPNANASRGMTEPLIVIDGPLMDAELLDASLSPAASHLGGDSLEEKSRTVTLLLRGLDETPLDVQQRIDQFISEHAAHVRVLALMQLTIDEATQAKKLTLPLAAKLDVLSIQIDSLASRVEDIPLIASAMVDSRHAAGAGPAERLNRAALDQLILYPWPANLDELDAAMRHAVAACTGPAIAPEHLPLAIRSYRPGEPTLPVEPLEPDLDRAVERYELRLIKAAIDASAGNRSEAARKLGISRTRLLRKLGEPESP